MNIKCDSSRFLNSTFLIPLGSQTFVFSVLLFPTCITPFPVDFLPLFLGISYSKRVSRQGPVWTLFTTPGPSTPQVPSLENYTVKGQEGKRRQTRKNIFEDKRTKMSIRKIIGYIIHLLLTTTLAKIPCN
jgi:hypothetical protein